MPEKLINFLEESYTAYHATENVKQALEENGFVQLFENRDWSLGEGGNILSCAAAAV